MVCFAIEDFCFEMIFNLCPQKCSILKREKQVYGLENSVTTGNSDGSAEKQDRNEANYK